MTSKEGCFLLFRRLLSEGEGLGVQAQGLTGLALPLPSCETLHRLVHFSVPAFPPLPQDRWKDRRASTPQSWCQDEISYCS